jgi:hypothetical protein
MDCAGQRPVVRPWRWAWAGRGAGVGGKALQGPGCCMHAPGAWRGCCWWSPLDVLTPSSCAGCSPAAFAVGVAASRAPPAAACGRASSPPPARMPLQTHRSLRAAFQKANLKPGGWRVQIIIRSPARWAGPPWTRALALAPPVDLRLFEPGRAPAHQEAQHKGSAKRKAGSPAGGRTAQEAVSRKRAGARRERQGGGGAGAAGVCFNF